MILGCNAFWPKRGGHYGRSWVCGWVIWAAMRPLSMLRTMAHTSSQLQYSKLERQGVLGGAFGCHHRYASSVFPIPTNHDQNWLNSHMYVYIMDVYMCTYLYLYVINILYIYMLLLTDWKLCWYMCKAAKPEQKMLRRCSRIHHDFTTMQKIPARSWTTTTPWELHRNTNVFGKTFFCPLEITQISQWCSMSLIQICWDILRFRFFGLRCRPSLCVRL